MEKFSLEFKKVVSEKYLEGELSLKSVARMYGISPCTVRKWAYAYREHGISILTGKKGRYSAELKLTVVKEVVDDCFSVREVAAYSALFDHGLASKSDQRFAYIRSTGNLTFSTAF
ncbi:transposase [Escherichia coli]|uniref:transposase n=3 Tax=Escherichia coli TaxID=562 RepID=UPI000B7C7374|nr:transposase [Escherichia coli]UXF06877.1 helix-turn-helix domain containing protein [Escherichia coli]